MSVYPGIAGAVWTAQFDGAFKAYQQPSHTISEQYLQFMGDGWHISRGIPNTISTKKDTDGTLHAILSSGGFYTLGVGIGVAVTVTVQCSAHIDGSYSVGMQAVDASGKVYFTTGNNPDGTLVQLPVTNGSIFIQ